MDGNYTDWLQFAFRQAMKLETHRAWVSRDAGMLAHPEVGEELLLKTTARASISNCQMGKNNQHTLWAISHRAIQSSLGLSILLMTILASGCPTLPPEYPVQALDQYRWTSSKDGLAVAIHPLVDESENKQYFGTDLLARGILPVLVVFQNRSSSSSFIISKEQCSLAGVTDQINRDNLPSGQIGEIVMLVCPLVGYWILADAENIQHSFVTKELKRQTVSTGKSAHGIVYFRLPERQAPHTWVMRVTAQKLRSKETVSLDIAFEWKRKRP